MRKALCAAIAASLIAAPAAPSGATLVDVQQIASGPSYGYIAGGGTPLPALSGVKAGDLIVVMAHTLQNVNPSGPPTDDASNTYTTDYNNTLTTRDDERVYHAIAAADAATLIVTLHNSSSFYGQIVAAVYRAPAGKTWSFDSANFSAHTNGYVATDISQTFNTSGPGVVCVLLNSGNADNSATYGLVGTCSGATIEKECPANSTAAIGYFGFFADYLTTAALNGYTIAGNVYTTTPGDTGSNKDLLIAPFVYS